MKKVAVGFVLIFVASLLFSCKSHQRCAAYSQVDVQKVQTPS